MKIVIDGDACPVIGQTVELAKKYKVEAIIVCDVAHVINSEYAKTIVVETSRDSADLKISNITTPHDIVVSADTGLAAICLGLGAFVISPNGQLFDQNNIMWKLTSRYENQKLIRHHKYPKKHLKKRTAQDNDIYYAALEQLLRGENICK